MTPEKFIAMGLQPKQKVKLTLKIPWKEGTKTVKEELYFLGYRILYGSSLAEGTSELVPVFAKPAKNGQCGRKHYQAWPTWFNYIASIKPINA